MKHSKEEKREVLFKAASEVLREYGPRKTTLGDIAKRSGMAKTSVYYYYKDKNEIIKAIIKSKTEQLLGMMTAAVHSAKSSEEKMNALIETRCRYISGAASRATKEVFDEFLSLENLYKEEKAYFEKEVKALIAGILREGIQNGELKPIEDIELVSMIMIYSMFGIDQITPLYDQRERVLEGIKKMLGIFFTGLKIK